MNKRTNYLPWSHMFGLTEYMSIFMRKVASNTYTLPHVIKFL